MKLTGGAPPEGYDVTTVTVAHAEVKLRINRKFRVCRNVFTHDLTPGGKCGCYAKALQNALYKREHYPDKFGPFLPVPSDDPRYLKRRDIGGAANSNLKEREEFIDSLPIVSSDLCDPLADDDIIRGYVRFVLKDGFVAYYDGSRQHITLVNRYGVAEGTYAAHFAVDGTPTVEGVYAHNIYLVHESCGTGSTGPVWWRYCQNATAIQ